MKTSTFLASAAFLVLTVLAAAPSHASNIGLTEKVYDAVPEYDWAPTEADITKEQAYMASTTPAYSFINSNTGFNYSSGSTVASYFGADAAGAALSDNTYITGAHGTGYGFGFDANGFINVSVSGLYTFNINQADDAARVTIDGSIVVDNNFQGGPGYSVPSSQTIYLTAGSHSFDLVYFQTVGGLNFSYGVTNAAGTVSYSTIANSVPEPASLALLGMGLVGMGFARRRKVAL